MPGPLNVVPVPELEAIRDEWRALAPMTRNVFATWEWSAIWWRHFGRRRTLLTAVCRSETDQTVGVLPLYLWRKRPLRVARFLGHSAGDELGPICLPADRGAVSQAVRSTLSRNRVELLVAEHLLVGEGWSRLLGAKVIARDPSPTLRLVTSDWEEFLASCTPNFRATVRRKQRQLGREGAVRYRLTERPEELERDLDTLFALHHARWGGRATTFSKSEAFHRDFAAHALELGWLRLWFLEIDGKPRATWYGFRFCGVESFYQGGRDPSAQWQRYSLGFLVLVHSLREALNDRVGEYRFLRGGEGYKFRFTDSDRAVETMAIARGPRARGALALATATRKSRFLRAATAP